ARRIAAPAPFPGSAGADPGPGVDQQAVTRAAVQHRDPVGARRHAAPAPGQAAGASRSGREDHMNVITRGRARRRVVVPIALLLALVSQACGFSHGPDFSIGFRRVALDLSYKDEALAAPPTRENVLVPQPVISNGFFVN